MFMGKYLAMAVIAFAAPAMAGDSGLVYSQVTKFRVQDEAGGWTQFSQSSSAYEITEKTVIRQKVKVRAIHPRPFAFRRITFAPWRFDGCLGDLIRRGKRVQYYDGCEWRDVKILPARPTELRPIERREYEFYYYESSR